MEYVLSHQSRGWVPIEKWVSVRSRTLRCKDRRSLVCCPCRNTVVLCDTLPPCLLTSALTSPFSLTVPVETFSCTPVLCSTLAFPFGWARLLLLLLVGGGLRADGQSHPKPNCSCQAK